MVVCCTLELLNEEMLHAWRPDSLSEVCGGLGCSSLSLKKLQELEVEEGDSAYTANTLAFLWVGVGLCMCVHLCVCF